LALIPGKLTTPIHLNRGKDLLGGVLLKAGSSCSGILIKNKKNQIFPNPRGFYFVSGV
jgi:hypothetical protein